jgi:hypothetical protein
MIGYSVNVNKLKIEEALFKIINEQGAASDLEIHSFKLHFQIVDKPKILIQDKLFQTNFPIKFNLKKDDFLFSIEGHGHLMLEINTIFNIDENFHLATQTSINGYKWIEEPRIDFGSMNIQVEQLVDMIIRHYDDSLSSAIDKSIKDAIDLPKLVKNGIEDGLKKLDTISLRELKVFVQPSEILVEPITTDEHNIIIKGAIRAEFACGTKNTLIDNGLKLRWVESLLSDNITYVDINIEEEVISSALCDFINQQEYGGEKLQASGCKVDFMSRGLDINLDLLSPVKASVNIFGVPRYNESDACLYMDNLSVKVNSSNILYKLSAPLLNKYLLNNISNRFPLDTESYINQYLGIYLKNKITMPNITIEHAIRKIAVNEIRYDDRGVYIRIKVSDIEAKIGLLQSK